MMVDGTLPETIKYILYELMVYQVQMSVIITRTTRKYDNADSEAQDQSVHLRSLKPDKCQVSIQDDVNLNTIALYPVRDLADPEVSYYIRLR